MTQEPGRLGGSHWAPTVGRGRPPSLCELGMEQGDPKLGEGLPNWEQRGCEMGHTLPCPELAVGTPLKLRMGEGVCGYPPETGNRGGR